MDEKYEELDFKELKAVLEKDGVNVEDILAMEEFILDSGECYLS